MSEITLSVERFNEILERQAELVVHKTLRSAGIPIAEYFTREEMKKKFGAGRINRMIKDGKLTPHRIGEEGRTLYAVEDMYKQIF